MKDVAAGVAALPASDIQTLLDGGTVDVAGVTLGPDDVTVTRAPRPGTVVESSGPLAVSLDTIVDDELRAEGLAREVISRIQQMRRDAGLDVSDRIELIWASSDAALADVVRAHQMAIAAEVLAETVVESSTAGTPVDVEGSELKLAINRI
jgi:isoleucyl-tRNA synthetase